MNKPDLVFLTPDNQDRVKGKLIEGGVEICNACKHVILGPHDCQAVDTKKPLEGLGDASEKPAG